MKTFYICFILDNKCESFPWRALIVFVFTHYESLNGTLLEVFPMSTHSQ